MTAMSVNRDRGEVALVMGGESYILHYDWAAVGRLRALLGIKDFDKKLRALGDGTKPKDMAEVVAIGLARNHPDITAEQILEIAPPLVPTVEAFNEALMLAFYGAAGAPEDDSPDGPLTSRATSSKRRGKRRTGRA